MACIFNIVLLDLSAAMTDSFEWRAACSRGGGLIGGFTVNKFAISRGTERIRGVLQARSRVEGTPQEISR